MGTPQAARARAAMSTHIRSWALRSVVAGIGIVTIVAAGLSVGTSSAGAAQLTTCSDGSLARQRTEVDSDIPVQQFDASLGTLQSVTVSDQTVHLDTDSEFENKTPTPQTFAARMQYDATFTNPAGLTAPAVLSGTIQRVPSQVFPAFDGVLDFLGPSSFVQPTTAKDSSSPTATSTDPTVLAAFTGTGTVPFHLTTQISEIFTGAGGNSASITNTFASATVKVCYQYLTTEITTTTTQPIQILAAVAVAHRATLPLAG